MNATVGVVVEVRVGEGGYDGGGGEGECDGGVSEGGFLGGGEGGEGGKDGGGVGAERLQADRVVKRG